MATRTAYCVARQASEVSNVSSSACACSPRPPVPIVIAGIFSWIGMLASVELSPGATVAELLAELGLKGPYALVERNGEPVERERYPVQSLEEGDRLVVARPVAGG